MDEELELTPEQEQAQRAETYGVFAGAEMDVDRVQSTVRITLRDTLKGKDKVEITTDVANASAWIFNDVFKPILAAAAKVHSFSGK